MHIIHIASEIAPVAKVGGLGDVILGLLRELSWKGHDVDVIIPNYDCKNSLEIRDLSLSYSNLMSYYQGEWHPNNVWMGWVENLKVYFIEPHHPRFFFNRGCFYGCADDIERFLYFSRAAMEFIYKKQLQADIIHLHDWQAAAVAPLYYELFVPMGFTKPKIVFTIHNNNYQGKCDTKNLDYIGLDGKALLLPEKLQDNQNPQLINLLKGAIVYSNSVTTVSPTYGREVLSEPRGEGLSETFNIHKNKFSGILNGLDYSFWNPEIDRYLPTHYSAREVPAHKKDTNTLDKKAFLKSKLRTALGLSEVYRPIVSCIARLIPQKGIDIIEHAMRYVIDHQGQFILLGTSPIPEIQERYQAIKHLYTEHQHAALILHHEEELAHLIYAGSDIFIIPSIFEPCGLTQMIALKYGTIPIVRRTGGLSDTVFDVDTSGRPLGEANGYTFDSTEPTAIDDPLQRAIDCWMNNPQRWRQMMISGMNMDFSWNRPSNSYLDIYTSLVKGD
jgi:starch synthase